MTWHVQWEPLVEADLRRLPHWLTAERLCKAIAHYAVTGEGTVERDQDAPYFARLVVRGAVALLQLDPTTRTIHVVRAFAR